MTQKEFYAEQLNDQRWVNRRKQILDRDRYLCVRCFPLREEEGWEIDARESNDFDADDRVLHVHHLCYRSGFKAWDYLDEDLITLCEDCHQNEHVRLFREKKDELITQYGLPRHKEGTVTAKEGLEHLSLCRDHPNWEKFCRAVDRHSPSFYSASGYYSGF
jgi:5-methylcytosine-specific restriction endonuclease McrA